MLVLTDTVVNPNDVSFDLSGFMFTIAGATGGTLTSSFGTPRTVAADGTFTDGMSAATGWTFTSASGTYTLNDLTGAGPANTIIGAPGAGNVYSNANNSITGNGPHNPFLAQSAMFIFTFTNGVSVNSLPTNIQWQFGTAPGFSGGGTSSSVPEPVSLSLVGGGLLGLGLLRKRLPR